MTMTVTIECDRCHCTTSQEVGLGHALEGALVATLPRHLMHYDAPVGRHLCAECMYDLFPTSDDD